MTWPSAAEYLALYDDLAGDLEWWSALHWAEHVGRPRDPEEMALELCWVVLNSGMKHTVAQGIWPRIVEALRAGRPVHPAAFGHAGKAAAMETLWRRRQALYDELLGLPDDPSVVAWCAALPWIGPITKYHAAKNLGADVAKPDRWLERIAAYSGETVDGLCQRLALAAGHRVGLVDLVLWAGASTGRIIIPEETPA